MASEVALALTSLGVASIGPLPEMVVSASAGGPSVGSDNGSGSRSGSANETTGSYGLLSVTSSS